MSTNLAETSPPIMGLIPATDAAGRTGAYVSMKGYSKLTIVVSIVQGHATPPALTLSQATAVAGTGAKAVSNTFRIWSNLDVSVADGVTARTAAATYSTDAALKNKIVIIEVRASDLDVAGGFDCVALVTGASNVANLTSAMYYRGSLRYQGSSPLSAVVD